MKVCIVGNGLVSLVLTKALINQGIYVDIFTNQTIKQNNKSRTLGISKVNIDFFNSEILDIKKLLWNINKIEIYSSNLQNEKILNFENKNKNLFSIIKNHELYNALSLSLNNNRLIKKFINKKLISKNYNLVINCDTNSVFAKKYFYKKISKNYSSFAHATIVEHDKIKNNVATQIFTDKGPMAFLPISNKETSVVYSARGSKNLDFKNIIEKFNLKYSINKINEVSSFELKSLDLRTYFFGNILAFGDILHTLHPLAGQGFNMSIRDIKLLLELIKLRMNNGLELDSSICADFEKKIRHKNFLFSNGIDFVYEVFNLESKMNNSILSKTVKFIGKNKYVNKFFINLADNGIVV